MKKGGNKLKLAQMNSALEKQHNSDVERDYVHLRHKDPVISNC